MALVNAKILRRLRRNQRGVVPTKSSKSDPVLPATSRCRCSGRRRPNRPWRKAQFEILKFRRRLVDDMRRPPPSSSAVPQAAHLLQDRSSCSCSPQAKPFFRCFLPSGIPFLRQSPRKCLSNFVDKLEKPRTFGTLPTDEKNRSAVSSPLATLAQSTSFQVKEAATATPTPKAPP